MIKVICTGVCVGPAHIRKTVDKNVPKSTGMSRISSCESACVRVFGLRQVFPSLTPEYLTCFMIYIIYITHIFQIYNIFSYTIYIYIYI
jgi:hypothetical protein